MEEGGGGSAEKARGQHPQGEEAEAGEACAFKTWPATPQAEFLARAAEASGCRGKSKAVEEAEEGAVWKRSEVSSGRERSAGSREEQSAMQAATLEQSQPLEMRLRHDEASPGGRLETREAKREGTTERTSPQESAEEVGRRSQEEGQRSGRSREVTPEKKATG